MVKVIKRDGTKEKFDKNKIIESCMKAGATREAAEEIASKVEKQVKEGTHTAEIRRIVLTELGKKNPEWSEGNTYSG